jgi:hypothetical protein
MVNKYWIFLLILGSSLKSISQIGGQTAYPFLNLHPNARIASLGGNAIANPENDINLASQNPSLLRDTMHNQIAFSHAFIFTDIQTGYFAHARHFKKLGTFAAGLQYFSYGNFKKTASNGEPLGMFTAGDYAFNIAYSRPLSDYVTIGTQVKFIYSTLSEFTSTAIAIDAGITYYNPKYLITLTAVFNNYGTQLSNYNELEEKELPFNVQLGFSKKLKNAPFRFSIIGKHLNNPGQMIYQNDNRPNAQRDLETGNLIDEDLHFGKYLMSHVNASTELLLGKSFYFAIGYNYLRRWEMGLKDFAGAAGFSWGFGLKVKKMQLGYGRNAYFIGNSTDHLSLVFNVQDFVKRSK